MEVGKAEDNSRGHEGWGSECYVLAVREKRKSEDERGGN